MQIESQGIAVGLGIRPTVRGVAMNPVDHPMVVVRVKPSGGRPSGITLGDFN
jgi:ribosomal protein L2